MSLDISMDMCNTTKAVFSVKRQHNVYDLNVYNNKKLKIKKVA